MIILVHCSNAVEISQLDYMRLNIRKQRWEAALSKYNKMDQILMIVSEYMLHQYVERECCMASERIEYCYNKHGKPQFLSVKNVKFNVSHAGDWVAIGLSDHDIGVDIENVAPLNYDFIDRYFTNEEQQYIRSAPTKQAQLIRFYEIWTCKESYVKMLGTGLSESLNSFTINSTYGANSIAVSPSSFNQHTTITSKRFSVKPNVSLNGSMTSKHTVSNYTENHFQAIKIRHASWGNMQLALCSSAVGDIPCHIYDLSPSKKLDIYEDVSSFKL